MTALSGSGIPKKKEKVLNQVSICRKSIAEFQFRPENGVEEFVSA